MTDITSVIDADENENASRLCKVVFCFGDEIIMICHY